MESKGKRGLLWFAAPLAICLPCLLPFILAAVLTAVGVGAVGSFLSDNAFLLAILIAFTMLVALVIGLGISRLVHWRRGSIRFLSRDG
ncbi:MAG: hypothetical protein IIA23_11765 [Chloroflexi bacterium]|nr:hypothetical protein [Chloroflexota bacterium]